MFATEQNPSLARGAFRIADLIFHNMVRSVRKGHRDAVFAIITSVLQTLVMIAAFYLFIDIVGLRAVAIRGDFLLYVMSGIFVFMIHIKAMGAVAGAEGPTSPMMQHLPMSTTVAIWSSALGSLYIQLISMAAILCHSRTVRRVYDDHAGMVFRVRCRISHSGGKTVVSYRLQHGATNLFTLQHVRLGQDVRRQPTTRGNGGDVFMEPAVSHHRPGSGLYLHQLQPAEIQPRVSYHRFGDPSGDRADR